MHHRIIFATLHRLSALSSGDRPMFSSGTLSTLSANHKPARAAGLRNVECDSRLGYSRVRDCPLQAVQAMPRSSERRPCSHVTAKDVVAELTCCVEVRFRCKGPTEFAWLSSRAAECVGTAGMSDAVDEVGGSRSASKALASWSAPSLIGFSDRPESTPDLIPSPGLRPYRGTSYFSRPAPARSLCRRITVQRSILAGWLGPLASVGQAFAGREP